MADVRGEVQHRAAPVDRFEILRERLELPRDACSQRRGIHVLDVLECANDHVVGSVGGFCEFDCR